MFDHEDLTVTSVVWHGEDKVWIVAGTTHWRGANRKDFFCPDEPWESRIGPGSLVRLWTIQGSRVIGLQWWHAYPECVGGGDWIDVWVVGNDFGTKAERREREERYEKAILATRDHIVSRLVDGWDFEAIWKEAMGRGLSGWQWECASRMAARDSKVRGPEWLSWVKAREARG